MEKNERGQGIEQTEDISESGPRPVLGYFDAIALIVGIVIGAGIFSFPSLVAANTATWQAFLLVWVIGGFVSLIGALCYAELSSTFPSAGGDYHFLKRAFGGRFSFLFAWSRMTVIQTGSVAILAFIFGDYATQLYSLGDFSPMIYAALVIVVLTVLNIIGIYIGSGTQKILTALEVAGLLLIIGAGLLMTPSDAVVASTAPAAPAVTSFGLAMVFVLLTFGGWNEAAYISAEMRQGKRQIAFSLIFGICIITALYLLVNLAYLNVLGLSGVAASSAVAGDTVRATLGDGAAWVIGLFVAIAALTSANATMFTGARTNYALGRDFPVLGTLGRWNDRADSPVNAFIVQGFIAIALVGLSMWTREGIRAIVDYTAPVFWFFFLMVGISLFVLRRKEPNVERPFRVPFYPVTPILFCLTTVYLLYSSIAYTGLGSLVGLGVLAFGAVILIFLPVVEKYVDRNKPGVIKMNVSQSKFLILFIAAVVLTGCGNDRSDAGQAQRNAVPAVETPVPSPTQRQLDVPYVPTPDAVVAEMLAMAEVKGSDILYDLGSGDGRIPITAAKRFGTRGVGIDLDPVRVEEANANAQREKVADKVTFKEGDIFKEDFSEATVITLYLLPEVNLRLRPELLKLKPGTRIVSHNYDMGSWTPEKTKIVKVSGVDRYVYFWRVPEDSSTIK
ncbi:MAG TPA: amino acid permease [Pyrinomonadaceae bacterium]|nr:amino acid permease [Pyrinomonadaceae bacterium]